MRLILSILSIVVSFGSTDSATPSTMLEMINNKVEPCDNFYQYACGNWLKSHEHSNERVHWAIRELEEHRDNAFQEIVKKPQVVDFWESCMALRQSRRIGSSKDPGNLPLLDSFKSISHAGTRHDIFKLAGGFSGTGTHAFIDYSVQPDEQQYTIYTLYLRPAKLTLPDDSYKMIRDPMTTHPYNDYIEELIKVAFKNEKRLQEQLHCKQAANIVIEMEKKLETIRNENNGKIKRLTVAQAIHEWPNTIGPFLNGFGESVNKKIASRQIYIEHPGYFNKLETLIKKVSINDLKSYLSFVMIHSRTQWLGHEFLRLWDEKMLRKKSVIHRTEFCHERLIEFLPTWVGQYYNEIAIDNTRRKKARDMVKLVKDAMKQHMLKSKWMSNDDIAQGLQKLDGLFTFVGQHQHANLLFHTFSRKNYYNNVQTILSDRFRSEMDRIGDTVDRKSGWPALTDRKMGWLPSPAIPQVEYNPYMNSVLFPISMLHSPFFDGQSVHPARDFGAMGTIMGREITRGFDKIGSGYGRRGNKQEWWSIETKNQFKEASKCMINQYSLYEIYRSKVDAALSQNMADAGGLALAWDAYEKYMNAHKNEKLPGTSGVTPSDAEKMFFLSFAQSLCTHIPRQHSSVSDPYPSPEWRVNIAIMNHEQFHMVYGCRANQKMNPVQKCNMW